ncbi:golgin subfamily B member 1 [Mixophyes fleayi]|uniref:golgin subfamily B member 1 n=1 Tax=Mixophyes fleayi TaxID=3061075 RepID=UPI003F4E25E3
MFSRFSDLANTVLHELSGDGEGSESTRESDPVPEPRTVEAMSDDQMETLAHYEQLVIQLKGLIQHKDAEICQKDTELQQREAQLKVEREASDAKFTKLKLQAKAKVATLNKQIEELKRAVTNQVSQNVSEDTHTEGQKETSQGIQSNEETTSKLQDNINDLTRQLQESHKNINELTKQLSESQESIATLTNQLHDGQESVTELTKALQESRDTARTLQDKQELDIHHLQRKLEEQSEALSSRNQVVEMLEQELQSAELQKQVLSEQFRQMEQELMSLRESVVTEQRESAQQTVLYKESLKEKDIVCQRLLEELDKEREANSELENLKAELERGKQAQNDMELLRNELEREKEAKKQIEEARQQLDIQAQHDLEQIRAKLEKQAQEEIERLRSDLEREKGAQEELELVRAELERDKVTQEHLKVELERLNGAKEGNESEGQQDVQQAKHELDEGNVELESIRSELEKAKESQKELSRLREELNRAKESLTEFDHVKDELERGQTSLDELERMKQELQKMRQAQTEFDKLQQELQVAQLEQKRETHEDLSREKFAQEEPVMGGVDVKAERDDEEGEVINTVNELHQVSFANSNTQYMETADSHITFSTEKCLESVDGQQTLHSTLNVETHSVSQEILVDISVEEVKEKQLSLLMMDLMDTQEEVKKLKGELTLEGALNKYMPFEQTIEETIHNIQDHDTSDMKCQAALLTLDKESVNGDGDSEVLLMKKLVTDLQYRLEGVTSEKEAIAFKLQSLLKEHPPAEKLPLTENAEIEKQQLTNYESQNILVEQVNSLENESKCKDSKITALQKDLDHQNLLLSDQNAISKQQEDQLKDKERHIESLKEMLNLSQNKEERLSEVLASNELETASLQALLSQKAAEIQSLQQSLTEKDQQVAEISHSLSDKVVLLNEEKYSMGKEIKALKEQLSSAIQDQSGKLKESLDVLQIENVEIRLQLENITKEKSQVQEMLESVQRELVELNSQLELVTSNYMQSQEIIKSVREEREVLQIQLQDQTLELLGKQKEHNELQIQVEAQKHDFEQQLQLLAEKEQNSLNAIECLQAEKNALEHQLHSCKSRPQQDESKSELNEKDDLQTQLQYYMKETKQLKKKLQAALVSRKELAKKVSVLEQHVVKHTDKQDRDYWVGSDDLEDKSVVQEVSEQNKEEILQEQVDEKASALENVRSELAEKSAANERLQTLIEELTVELSEKSRHIESLNKEQMERLTAESQGSDAMVMTSHLNAEDETDAKLQLENRINSLEHDKENLQKKVQEALNSRKDTIKKAQEKDRHHREQLKQQKEEFNLLQERYKHLQENQISNQGHERFLEERGTQTGRLYPLGKPQDTMSNISDGLNLMVTSDDNTDESNWGKDWVEFSPADVEDSLVDKSSPVDMTPKSYQTQLDLLQTQRNELELKVLHWEKAFNERLEEISHLHDTLDDLTRQLKHEREKCQDLEAQASTLKAELEGSKTEISTLHEFTIGNIKEELTIKREEVVHLHQELEEQNLALKNANLLLSEKDDVILSLKTQVESQAKEYEEHHRKLEIQVLEVQQKHDQDVEEAKGKQSLQRKLQAALISRKEALKESKALKLELGTLKNHKEDLSNRLQIAEGSVTQLSIEKDNLQKSFTAQKEERDKLIMEIDKCLLENQNFEASCESLKLALAGITQEKDDLRKELEYLGKSQNSQTSEWKERLSELQKEYETLLQSYENVSNETDRMKRAVETVRQEKQEVFSKMKSVEAEKKEVEKQLEESEQEIESIKEKMRKFAKSKQQKILELEEENDRLRGESQPTIREQMYDTAQGENTRLKEELEKVHSENNNLLLQLEGVKSEKDAIAHEIETLKLKLHNVELDLQNTLEEHMSEVKKKVVSKHEAVDVACPPPKESEVVTGESQTSLELVAEHEGNQQRENLEKISQLEELIMKLENNTKTMEHEIETMSEEINVLKENKQRLETQLISTQDEGNKLEKEIANWEKKYQIVVNDLAKQNRLKQAIELDKDELEERLMNQMAELNGSIGNFQQDAIDLQIKNDNLQRELEVLHLQLEEERRQLERQKAEVLSEVQKEYLEKLKSVHQGEKGRKTQSKELQELLKEKQQEVRHLQKDCIQYQETISGLERAIKALEFVHNECAKEKVASDDRVAKAMVNTQKAQADLTALHVLLDDTQSEAARVLAENMKLKDEMRAITENAKLMVKKKDEEMDNRLEQERDKHLKQMVNLQEKIHLLQQEKEQLEGSIVNLHNSLDEKNLELKDLQGNLNQNIAKLAAFTHSMCSLQNDRDRVIEESKKWSEKFTETMHKKDIEISDKEKACVDIRNELLHITLQMEELKVQVTRLQLENNELIATGQAESEVHLKMRDSLLEEKAILSSCLEEEQKKHSTCQEELKLRSEEARDRLSLLETTDGELKRFQSEKENLLGAIKNLEAEVQDWKLLNEQIQRDLQASKSLIDQLHIELEQKEQDVVRLLSARDEAVSTAVGELHDLHAIEFKALKERLEEAEQDGRTMQEKIDKLTTRLKVTQEEANQSKAQLVAFTKSMCSLQEERECVLSDYQQLEQRHLDAILAKDGLIQEAAAESNKLREELRFLHSRTDDLNAQNAKLNAQLIRYREDLKELISLKDSQLKQLLGEKLQEIEKLRQEQINQDELLNREIGQREILQQELDETKKAKQGLQVEVDSLNLCVSQLQTENEARASQLAQEEQAMKMQKDELQQIQKELSHVKEETSRIQAEAKQQVQCAEDEMNKKMKSIQHDTGILRNEAETAEERVAELARDLMEAEQRLLNASEEISSLKAQLHAFEGSMRSLQDSHDLAEEEIQRLQEQLKEGSALNIELNTVKTERDSLKVMLSESKEQQYKIEMQLKELTLSLQVREEEVNRMTSDLQVSQEQLQNMSIAMGGLQEEHRRLQDEFKAPRREVERTLQSSYQRDKIPDDGSSSLYEELQSAQTEVHNLRTQLSDALTQVHHKEHRIQQLNVKLSQLFEEKNALSLQLRGNNQNLRDAISRCSSFEQQLLEIQQKNLEVLPINSAPGAPQEKKEPQTNADQQMMELQQRCLELKQQNTEQEQVRAVLEQQLREERQKADYRIQEMEENMKRSTSHDWSDSQDHVVPHELSLLMEPHDTTSIKTRSSSLRRLLRLIFCSRTRTPILTSIYVLIIHVLLFLCFTGHL